MTVAHRTTVVRVCGVKPGRYRMAEQAICDVPYEAPQRLLCPRRRDHGIGQNGQASMTSRTHLIKQALPSGADLTFATRLAANSGSEMSNLKLH